MRLSGALAGLCLCAAARLAHAEPEPGAIGPADSEPAPEPPKPVPSWSFRIGVAGGAPVESDQEELLELEGYGNPRWALWLGASHKLTDNIGAGVLGLYGWRSATWENDDEDDAVRGVPPTYGEQLLAVGAQLPLSLRVGTTRDIVLSLAPWGGVGFANADFADDGKWQTGPAFGLGTGLFFSRAYLGLSLGAYWVPTPPPGEAGGHNDFGMIYLSLFFGLDVG